MPTHEFENFDQVLRYAFSGVYAYLCGFTYGDSTATVQRDAPWRSQIAPQTLRDLETVMLEQLGMTESEVLALRVPAQPEEP